MEEWFVQAFVRELNNLFKYVGKVFENKGKTLQRFLGTNQKQQVVEIIEGDQCQSIQAAAKSSIDW